MINPAFEAVHDIGLLFGGTEDQSLHHDTARQTTSWASEKTATENTIDSLKLQPGWEIDRLEYNEAMASPHAPSSLVIGLGPTDEIFLGVQKDCIERVR